MNKKNLISFLFKYKFFLFYSLIFYSVYCSLTIGSSWDLRDHYLLGKSTFNYIFSFGKINNSSYVNLREYNSSSYWTIVYFFTQFFPKYYELKIFNLFNLFISCLTLVGFYKLGKILFNKNIGLIFLLILLFYPIFFGHMSINPKDTVLTMAHIWIFYLVIYYLKKQNDYYDTKKITYKIAIIFAVATGIQLYFAISLVPIFIFLLIEVFFLKKIQNKSFSKKKFYKDLFITFIIFYIFLIFFWIDTHDNIILKPIELFITGLQTSRGWEANLLNGEIIFSSNAPWYYLIYLLIHKSPEYILFLYLFFFLNFFKVIRFYKKKDNLFFYKFYFLLLIFIFPNIIIQLNPFPLYDGLRLFLWSLPYFLVIPGLTINYLLLNISKFINRIYFFLISFFFIYYIFIFFSYTPYHYTYLNLLSGKTKTKNEKFESDYWGTSLGELIYNVKKKFPAKNNENLFTYFCAVPGKVVKEEILKNKISNIYSVDINQAEYIILTNRVFVKKDVNQNKLQLDKCLNYVEENLISIKRLDHTLSIFGKIKKN